MTRRTSRENTVPPCTTVHRPQHSLTGLAGQCCGLRELEAAYVDGLGAGEGDTAEDAVEDGPDSDTEQCPGEEEGGAAPGWPHPPPAARAHPAPPAATPLTPRPALLLLRSLSFLPALKSHSTDQKAPEISIAMGTVSSKFHSKLMRTMNQNFGW